MTIARRKNNTEFEKNEAAFYKNLTETNKYTGNPPNIEEFEDLWANIWETEGKINKDANWMNEIKREINNEVKTSHPNPSCSVQKWKEVIIKKKNWSSPGIDGIQNYWIKKMTAVWQAEVNEINKYLNGEKEIPEWLGRGRTVLIPKSNDLTKTEKYRPITCLITMYKNFTAIMADIMTEHLKKNNLWDEQQKGTRSNIMGTADNLLVDRCMLEEVKEHQRIAAAAYYDYQKAYDTVPHEWQIEVMQWLKFHPNMINIMKQLQSIWKTQLIIKNGNEKITSRWIRFKRGFYQGDNLSPVEFCITEIPLGRKLAQRPGYQLGPRNNRGPKVTHFYFIDDLKVVESSEIDLQETNRIVTEISQDTGMTFGVSKCEEVVYKRGKMIKGEGLQIDNNKAECLDPEDNEYYKFLGIEEGDGQLDEKAKERVIEECFKRVESLRRTELYERNMIKALNTMCMSAVTYVMNIVHFSRPELEHLDVRMRKTLKEMNWMDEKSSEERLYMTVESGGRGLLSFEYIYNIAKIRISNYLSHAEDPLLQTVLNRELAKTNSKSITKQAEVAFQDVGIKVKFDRNKILVNEEELKGNHHQTASKLKTMYQKKYQEKLGLQQGTTTCRLCEMHPEGTLHWMSACPYLAGSEYLKRHNQALKVFYVALAKQIGLIDPKIPWFNTHIAPVIENEVASIHWNIKMATHTTVEHRWPDLRVEWKKKQLIEVFDMACPLDCNVTEKEKEKIRDYGQLCYDLRRQNPTQRVVFHPLVIGATGRLSNIKKEVNSVIEDTKVTDSIVREMQKTVVVYTQQMIHRILTGLL